MPAEALRTARRTRRLSAPTTAPIATAITTARMKSPATDHTDTEVAVAAIAARSITSADASLSMLSPSSMVTTRGGTPSRLTIVVATASVGLITAPSATPMAKSTPGTTSEKK